MTPQRPEAFPSCQPTNPNTHTHTHRQGTRPPTVELGDEVGEMQGADEREVAGVRREEDLLFVVCCFYMFGPPPRVSCCRRKSFCKRGITGVQGWLNSAPASLGAMPLPPPLAMVLVRFDMARRRGEKECLFCSGGNVPGWTFEEEKAGSSSSSGSCSRSRRKRQLSD